jgi:hypothetical protein
MIIFCPAHLSAEHNPDCPVFIYPLYYFAICVPDCPKNSRPGGLITKIPVTVSPDKSSCKLTTTGTIGTIVYCSLSISVSNFCFWNVIHDRDLMGISAAGEQGEFIMTMRIVAA